MKKSSLYHVVVLGLIILTFTCCKYPEKETVPSNTDAVVPFLLTSHTNASYSDILKSCNLLLKGTCERITTSEPEIGYTSYTFSAVEVLGGSYGVDTFTLILPTDVSAEYRISDKDRYLIGHSYLLPIEKRELVFEPYYVTGSFSLVLDLTSGSYTLNNKPVVIPEGKTIEAYSYEVFSSVPHIEETRKQYSDEFEEFYEESDFICKMKVIEDHEVTGRAIILCECLEAYKGKKEQLYSLNQDGLISIAVRNGTVQEGQTYIIGFKDGSYVISTKNAVKPISEDLIQMLLSRKQ